MARPIVITWPAPDTAAICALQTTAGAGSLLINGTLANIAIKPTIVVLPGINRTISLTSAGNLAAVNFTISGTLNGSLVSETRAGPNANTVFTTQIFDSVTQVNVDAAVGTAVSVGTGTTGSTDWVQYNTHATVYGFGAQVVVTNTINYTLQATMDDVNTVAVPFTYTPNDWNAKTTSYFGGLFVEQQAYTGAGAPTYNAPVFVPVPFSYVRILINSSTNGSLISTFIQQGIT